MRFFKFVKTIPVEATVFAGISLCALFIKIFWLDQLPEVFLYAFEVGKIIESLLQASVSGYLFYVAVNHTKDVRDRCVTAPFIVEQTRRVIGECLAQLVIFNNETSVELNFNDLRTL